MTATITEIMDAATARLARQRGNGHDDAPACEPWGEPDRGLVDTARAEPPALPLEIFGEFWSAWIADAARVKSAPADFVALALLSTVGGLTALHRRACPTPDWAEPTILWTALVGDPSSGKSPALDAVSDLSRTLEEELNEDYPERRREWKTRKKEAELKLAGWEKSVAAAVKQGVPPPLMSAECEEPERVNQRRLRTSDATPEKLVRLAAANPYGLVMHRDELAGWVGGMDRYNGAGSERALWLEAYGARSFTVDRVKDDAPIHCGALAVGILGGIQPDRLATLLLGGDDDGLSARLLYGWPAAVPLRPLGGAAEGARALSALRRLLTLQRGPSGPIHLPFTPAARALLDRWRQEVRALEEGSAGLMKSWVGKLPGLAVRLAAVLAHLWWVGDDPGGMPPVEIDEAALLAGVAFLAEYATPMTRRCFGDAARPQVECDAAGLAKWILAQRPLPEVVNARAMRHAGAIPTREAVRHDAALSELADAGWLRPLPSREGGAKGRQAKNWLVNPKLGQAG